MARRKVSEQDVTFRARSILERHRSRPFTGTLIEPIDDVDCVIPLRTDLDPDSPEYRKLIDERLDRLFKLRIAKMPELARQLGMQLDAYDLSTHTGLMQFYGDIALNLVIKFEIPGFLEVDPKWNRSIVLWTLVECEKAKLSGTNRLEPSRGTSDFEVCLWVVRELDRDLKRRVHETAAKKRARTLANRVSELRQRLKRERNPDGSRALSEQAIALFNEIADPEDRERLAALIESLGRQH